MICFCGPKEYFWTQSLNSIMCDRAKNVYTTLKANFYFKASFGFIYIYDEKCCCAVMLLPISISTFYISFVIYIYHINLIQICSNEMVKSVSLKSAYCLKSRFVINTNQNEFLQCLIRFTTGPETNLLCQRHYLVSRTL